MSTKPRKSSKGKAADRKFAAAVWTEARRLAEKYHVILHCEDGHWYGRGLELPHVYGDGTTAAQCTEATIEALAVAVGYLIESDQRPPTPASSGTRTQQVNVRLTVDEKILFEAVAKRKGFQGISDFIRAAALEATH